MLILIPKPCKKLGVRFWYNRNLEQDKIFTKKFSKLKNILKFWRMRQLTLERRIRVFKSLAVSKVIHILLITKLHNSTIDFLYKTQKTFIWQTIKAKIKHNIICKKGGIKDIDWRNKIASMQCS